MDSGVLPMKKLIRWQWRPNMNCRLVKKNLRTFDTTARLASNYNDQKQLKKSPSNSACNSRRHIRNSNRLKTSDAQHPSSNPSSTHWRQAKRKEAEKRHPAPSVNDARPKTPRHTIHHNQPNLFVQPSRHPAPSSRNLKPTKSLAKLTPTPTQLQPRPGRNPKNLSIPRRRAPSARETTTTTARRFFF